MHDPGDRGKPFPLGRYLTLCDPNPSTEQSCLRKDFDDADGEAIHGQGGYKKIVRSAAILGLGVLLWGLFQHLFGPFFEESPALHKIFFCGELLYTLGVLGLVLYAIVTSRRDRWLNERFKAERLRLLKFNCLIDPLLWQTKDPDLTSWRSQLEVERNTIAAQSEESLETMKISDAMPDLPSTGHCKAVEIAALQCLLEYYQRKRLDSQLRYFAGRIKKGRGLADSPHLPPIFFFVGIALALGNLILEWATHGTVNVNAARLSNWLVFGSFAAPLGWSALRTQRGAHEVSRNLMRSHARHGALSEISRSLSKATGAPPEEWDRPVIFGYLYLCENILAADQHEWIRLMGEAEWYG
jgi:hypothetical protein